MNIKKVENASETSISIKKLTTEDLQNEYDYILAEKLLQNMLEKSVITIDEFNKITALNRQSFSPFLVEIMPWNR